MAAQEGELIHDVTDELLSIIQSNAEKITFIYGQIDQYTPLHYVDELLEQVPNAKVHLAKPHVKRNSLSVLLCAHALARCVCT
jgi:hypothetical protein